MFVVFWKKTFIGIKGKQAYGNNACKIIQCFIFRNCLMHGIVARNEQARIQMGLNKHKQ